MRDCVFRVADGHMEAVIATFLSRDRFFASLGTCPFHFSAEHDLVKAGNDPAVYHRAHLLLRPYLSTHRRAVVMFDRSWQNPWRPEELVAHVHGNLARVGWEETRFEVILIEPELEAWIWQDNPHLDHVFYRNVSDRAGRPALRTWLRDQGLWPDGAA